MTEFSNAVNKIVGSRIKIYRSKNKMNQQDLGESVGLTRVSVSNIESGRHQIPISTLYKIGDILMVDVRDIMPGSKEVEAFINKDNIDIQLRNSCILNPQSLEILELIISKTLTHDIKAH